MMASKYFKCLVPGCSQAGDFSVSFSLWILTILCMSVFISHFDKTFHSTSVQSLGSRKILFGGISIFQTENL